MKKEKLYDRFTDIEKKTFPKKFLVEEKIYEEGQKAGRYNFQLESIIAISHIQTENPVLMRM